ncbi:MAG: chalcone isomerase family protein [Burkholderiales bacterium]|nr:chalcone isomerase family protein [Burkholderiales bacterium]
MIRFILGSLMIPAAMLAGAAAQAKSCEGVTFPDQVQAGGAALALNGLGLRKATILKVKVYVGALYLPQASKDAGAILKANAPKRLVLHFVRDVGGDDLSKGWDEGFENNAGSALAELKPRIESFKAMMTDVKKGDTLAMTHKPGAGVEVAVKGASKGTIKGDDFARALFAIWLGKNPPNEDLKSGLLGGECG